MKNPILQVIDQYKNQPEIIDEAINGLYDRLGDNLILWLQLAKQTKENNNERLST